MVCRMVVGYAVGCEVLARVEMIYARAGSVFVLPAQA
jgi:hypothetical protein